MACEIKGPSCSGNHGPEFCSSLVTENMLLQRASVIKKVLEMLIIPVLSCLLSVHFVCCFY